MSDERPMAERHEWGDGFFVEVAGGSFTRGGASSVAEIERELLRVVAERDEARLQHQMSEGVLAMAVARLGGMVEGRPTHRINFLQRIDELVRIEAIAERFAEEIAALREEAQRLLFERRQTVGKFYEVGKALLEIYGARASWPEGKEWDRREADVREALRSAGLLPPEIPMVSEIEPWPVPEPGGGGGGA